MTDVGHPDAGPSEQQLTLDAHFTPSIFLYMFQKKAKQHFNTLLRKKKNKNKKQLQQQVGPVSITALQTKRPRLLSVSPVSLNKAFICSFYRFLFISQYVIKAGLHSDAAVSLMSLPGPLTAAQYNTASPAPLSPTPPE